MIHKDREIRHRTQVFERGAVDLDARTVQMAVSSETPVARSFGNEILDHSAESVDLDFFGGGAAPLLKDHDPTQQIGVVETVGLDETDRMLRAQVRFSRSALADEILQDIADGIRSQVSVGYSVGEMKRDGDDYRVMRWRPVESSIVSIPADSAVGIGRANEMEDSMSDQETVAEVEREEEPVIEQTPAEPIEEREAEFDEEAARQEITQRVQVQVRKDVQAIYELGERHGRAEIAQKAIQDGKSLDEAREIILASFGDDAKEHSMDIGLTEKETREFSIVRAIRAMANPTSRRLQQEAEFEFEASNSVNQERAGEGGLVVPHEVLTNWLKRDLSVGDDPQIVGEDWRPQDFIEALRNASSVMRAGATMLRDLDGDVKIPRQATGAASAWIATEGADAAESDPTFTAVTLTPKHLGVTTEVTKKLLTQSSLDVEQLIRSDLAIAMSLGLDNGACNGAGTSGAPTGIKNTSGINTTTFAAANPTFVEVVAMESAVATDNALLGNLAYIMRPDMYGTLKTTAKDAGSGLFVADGGVVNGYQTLRSNQVTSGDAIFGNFRDLIVGFFGSLEIIVDPYTKSRSGNVVTTAHQFADVGVRNAVSFCLSNDG